MDFSRLSDYLDTLPHAGFPAGDMIVALDGKVLFRKMFGFSDPEGTRPVSENDLYRLFSISKITTCVAGCMLLEQGKMNLDDPVSKYLPAYAHLTVKRSDGSVTPAGTVMTIRHLFTMSGGLDYTLRDGFVNDLLARDPHAPTLEVLNAFAKRPLFFEPGTRFRYSLCHDVLAGVIEVISGMKFSDFVKKNIFDPLGMTDTWYHLPASEESRLTTLYQHDMNRYAAKAVENTCAYIIDDGYDSGGAGLTGTASDQMKLITMLALGGISPDGVRILKEETVRAMGENLLPVSAISDFASSRDFGYGWGLCGRAHMDPIVSRSESSVGEFGWDGAAGSYILADPATRVSIFFATSVMNSHYVYRVVHPTLKNLAFKCVFDRA